MPSVNACPPPPQLVNMSKLGASLGVSHKTVGHHLEILEQTFIVSGLGHTTVFLVIVQGDWIPEYCRTQLPGCRLGDRVPDSH